MAVKLARLKGVDCLPSSPFITYAIERTPNLIAIIYSDKSSPNSTCVTVFQTKKLYDDALDITCFPEKSQSILRLDGISSISLYESPGFERDDYLAVGFEDGFVRVYKNSCFDKPIMSTVDGGLSEHSKIVAIEFLSSSFGSDISLATVTRGGRLLVFNVDHFFGHENEKIWNGEESPLMQSKNIESFTLEHYVEYDLGYTPRGPVATFFKENIAYFAIGCDEGLLLALSLEREQVVEVKTIKQTSDIQCLEFSTKKSRSDVVILAAGLQNGDIALIDATSTLTHPSFEPFYYISGSNKSSSPVISLDFFRLGFRGSHILAVASGKHIRVIDMSSFNPIYDNDMNEVISKLIFDFCEGPPELIVAWNGSGGASWLKLDSWDMLSENFLLHGSPIHSLAFSSESEKLLVGGTGGINDVSVFETRNWKCPSMNGKILIRDKTLDSISTIDFSPTACLLSAAKDSTVNVYHVENWKTAILSGIYSIDDELQREPQITVVKFSPNGKFLLIGGEFSLILIIDPNRFHLVSKFPLEGGIRCAAWSPDERFLCVGGISFDKVSFYNTAEDFSLLKPYEGLLDVHAISLSFNSSSSRLAIGCKYEIVFVDISLSTWARTRSLRHKDAINCLQFSPDTQSRFLAVVSNQKICEIYNSKSLVQVQHIEVAGSCLSTVAFNSCGTMLAIGNSVGGIKIATVGEFLSPLFFPLQSFKNGGQCVTPKELCKRLKSMTVAERNQFLYSSLNIASNASFPLEKSIKGKLQKDRQRYDRKKESEKILEMAPTVDATIYLREIISEFPLAIFASQGNNSIFETALMRRDHRLLGIALHTALVKCVERPHIMMNSDFRGGRLINVLINTCDIYPDIVSRALTNLVYWPVPIQSNAGDYRLRNSKAFYREASTPAIKGLYDDVLEESEGGVLARPMVFPLPGISSLPMLNALIKCPVDLFYSEDLKYMINELWETNVKKYFMTEFILFLLFSFVWARLVTTVHMSFIEDENRNLSRATGIEWTIVFIINLYFGWREISQVKMSATISWFAMGLSMIQMSPSPAGFFSRLLVHLKDLWNVFDLILFLSINVSLFLLIIEGKYTDEFSVVSTFLLTLKHLQFLSCFENTSWLITVLAQNIKDSSGFLIVIGSLIAGFAVIFRILLGEKNEDYRDYGTAAFNVFDVGVVGDFDPSVFGDSRNPLLTQFLFSFLVVVVTVVAMNGYIALLGDSYSSVKEQQTAIQTLNRTRTLVGYYTLLTSSKRDFIENERRYYHALLPINHEDSVAAYDAKKSLLKRTVEVSETGEVHS